jgi:L-2-amino-thiazoline-4-carboxylic acid hydrolase-like protein
MRTHFGSILANRWARNFFRSLHKTTVETTPSHAVVVENIKRQAQGIFDARRASLPDRRARLVLTLCSLILASYRELLNVTGDPKEAEEIVGKTLLQTNQASARVMTRVFILSSRNPFRLLSRVSLKGISELTYGRSMGFDQERTQNSVSLIVNRCAFHQFFIDNGEPQLTQLLCLWDRNWMDPINSSNRPVRIERPTTISTGSETCQFRFVNDELKENKETIDVLPMPVNR